MAESAPGPPHEWLQHLHGAKQWERLNKVALDCLAAYPEDEVAHYHRAWATLKLKRFKEMETHVNFLLGKNPESVANLQLAGLLHVSQKRLKKAQSYFSSALEIAPESGMLWYLAASVEIQLGNLKKGQEYSRRARHFEPDNADIAQFSIQLVNIEKTSVASSLAEIREYEEALALNPDSDSLLASIGDLYLTRLEMPERAEEYYRWALQIDPMDKSHQRGLWHSIQAQNILFRTLRLPMAGMELVAQYRRALRLKPWLFVFLLIGAKLLLAFGVWLTLAFVILAPVAWCVEWLVLADIQRVSRMADRLGNWWLRFHQTPFWLRLAGCLALIGGLWWRAFAYVGTDIESGFLYLVGFFVLHLVILAVWVGVRRLNTWFHTRKTKPPPLPKMPEMNG
jgi:tetratricopeptide (TPR) repeat protein